MSAPSSARVDISTPNNATFSDAYQFDPPSPWSPGATGCTGPTWNMANQNLRMDIKGNREQPDALLSLLSSAGEIIIADQVNRIIYFNVPEVTLTAALVPGRYVYDLIMFDGSTPPIRVVLMHGDFVLTNGVTGG